MFQPEYGPTGPTAVKDINPHGTGLSDAAAAFIAANASPFTNPRDMPCLAKVPDPRNQQNTKTMFIWGHFDIPVVTVGTNGSQLIASSPDPLAPVPVTWMGGASVDNATTRMTPNDHARRYEASGFDSPIYQMRELGKRAKTYRVVGHGLKAWVSKNTQVSRGNIEAGQFNFADTRNMTPSDPSTWSLNQKWSNAPGTDGDIGAQAMFIQCADLNKWRSMINSAKEQDFGFLAADEGATVRWTDSNDFMFQTATDRGMVFPNGINYGTNGAIPWETINMYNHNNVTAAQSIQFHPTEKQTLKAVSPHWLPDPYNDINALGTLSIWDGTGSTQTFYAEPTTTLVAPTTHNYYGIGDRERHLMAYQKTDNNFSNYVQSADMQFNRGLYIDVQGVDPAQVITVQVVWQIEYQPKGIEPWNSQPSPVDTSYDIISAMLRDRRAFPIVVKGHSFFSSLRNAMGKAANFFKRGVSAVAPIASSVLANIPDPRAQAAGMAIGALGNIMSTKRARAADYDLD